MFFKSWGGYMQKVLKAFDTIFVQEMTSKKLLESIQIQSVLAGDTRYDRVMENAKNVKSIPMVSDFVKDKKVFIMGSSWSVGEEVIFPSIDKLSSDWKVIIAPHEIHEAHIVEIEKKLNKETIRFSKLEEIHDGSADILIIDNIGMLMHLYQYADIAYVGGAFGSGLHNVLEPACFGVPVIFGPKHDKFREAQDFIDHEIGYAIEDRSAFDSIFSDLQRQDKKRAIQNFMKDRTGATEIIYEGIA
jgi:3-deoxy-D-manno-octulosonic-acid transferase